MTAMTVTFPTAAEFRAWLEAKPADEVIAERWDIFDCPLCKCLSDRGAGKPAMRYSGWQPVSERPGDVRGIKKAPDWAYYFMALIDTATDDNDAIPAADCLAVLRRAAPEAFSDG